MDKGRKEMMRIESDKKKEPLKGKFSSSKQGDM